MFFFPMKYRVNWCLNQTIHLRCLRDQLWGISTSWNPTPLPQPQFRVASWQLWQLWLTQRGCSWSSCSFYMFLWLRSRPCSLECLELSCSHTHSRFFRKKCLLRNVEKKGTSTTWNAVNIREHPINIYQHPWANMNSGHGLGPVVPGVFYLRPRRLGKAFVWRICVVLFWATGLHYSLLGSWWPIRIF